MDLGLRVRMQVLVQAAGALCQYPVCTTVDAQLCFPPLLLQDVLTWLAAQPMVHWISPLPRMQLQNNQASAITQAGTGALSTSQNSFDNPEVHPIWAAGITGTGQVIGGGDSGVGEAAPWDVGKEGGPVYSRLTQKDVGGCLGVQRESVMADAGQ